MFNDEKSKAQIAIYLRDAMPAAKDRNRVALKRWDDNHKQAWELEHLSSARIVETLP